MPVKTAHREKVGEGVSVEIATLGTALPEEIARCQELLIQYAFIGPAGNFGAAMIRAGIAAAHKAMMEGDTVAMLRAYQELKDWK